MGTRPVTVYLHLQLKRGAAVPDPSFGNWPGCGLVRCWNRSNNSLGACRKRLPEFSDSGNWQLYVRRLTLLIKFI